MLIGASMSLMNSPLRNKAQAETDKVAGPSDWPTPSKGSGREAGKQLGEVEPMWGRSCSVITDQAASCGGQQEPLKAIMPLLLMRKKTPKPPNEGKKQLFPQ